MVTHCRHRDHLTGIDVGLVKHFQQSVDLVLQSKRLLGQLTVMFGLFPGSLSLLTGLFKKHLVSMGIAAGLDAFPQERLVACLQLQSACFQFLNTVHGGIKE